MCVINSQPPFNFKLFNTIYIVCVKTFIINAETLDRKDTCKKIFYKNKNILNKR